MKRIFTSLLTTTIFGFLCVATLCADECCCERYYQNCFSYLRVGGGWPALKRAHRIAPEVSIGRRWGWGENKAIDLSASLMSRGKNSGTYYSIPKVLVLFYPCPCNDSSFFFGGGLSYAGITSEHKHYHGLFGDLALGYEWGRFACCHTFVQADLSQGLVAVSKKGSTPAPALSLSVGVGF